jgi:hypothetical protein
MVRNKMSKSDLKKRILSIVIISIAFTLIFTLISSPWPEESSTEYHYDIPVLNEDGKEIGGVHLKKGDPDYRLEDICVVVINLTSSLSDQEYPVNGTFECTNTSYDITYVNDGDEYFDEGDHLRFCGCTEGCILRFVRKSGETLAEVWF